MSQYDRTNTGVLFKNDRKESDRHPDYKGSLNIDGREFWLSAWLKDGSQGKFLSMAVKPKDEQQAGPPARGGTPRQNAPRPTQRQAPATAPKGDTWADDFDSDPIPFVSGHSPW